MYQKFNTVNIFIPIVLASAGYLLIISGLLFRNEKNNFATWTLWTVLDIIVLIGLEKSGADATLAWTFTIGTGITALCLLIKKQVSWGVTETRTALLAIFCTFISYLSTPLVGIIAGSIAVFIAGIPYLRFLRNNTINGYMLAANLLFLLCSASSLFISMQKGVSAEGIFPLVCTTYWLIGGYLSRDAYFNKKNPTLTS